MKIQQKKNLGGGGVGSGGDRVLGGGVGSGGDRVLGGGSGWWGGQVGCERNVGGRG